MIIEEYKTKEEALAKLKKEEIMVNFKKDGKDTFFVFRNIDDFKKYFTSDESTEIKETGSLSGNLEKVLVKKTIYTS